MKDKTLVELLQDVKDYKEVLEVDEGVLVQAEKNVYNSKIRYAEAIISLEKYKKENNIK